MISLKEALVRKNRVADIDELNRNEILKFLDDNYFIYHHWNKRLVGDQLLEILKFEKNNVIDIEGDKVSIHLKTPLDSFTNGMFKFGKIHGDLIIDPALKLQYLPKNGPVEVDNMVLNSNDFLKSLKGCPKILNNLDCYMCQDLLSVEGLKYVGGDITFSLCTRLKDLKKFPANFSGVIYLDNTSVKSLKDLPRSVKKILISKWMGDDLKDIDGLEGKIKYVRG